ncbi:hypothetical protein PV941_03345 [Ligilactobacillus salivarius]|nr:hypothetical protein [Ligilactobacillus salivarius]
MKKKMQFVGIIIVTILLAFISTYPAFFNHSFKLTWDGPIHLWRFEAISDALRNGKLPPIVNFMGYGNVGEAFNGIYPWLTSLIFVIPRIIFTNKPLLALFVGFYLLNTLTILNAYLLVRKLSENYWIKIIGITLYQLNSYHMMLLYSRDAWGEALAYTFLPLVMLGCYLIWNNKKLGILHLSLGMGLIVNSHVISIILIIVLISIMEIYRVCLLKVTFKECKYFILSGLFTIPSVIFTITNILNIIIKNAIKSPWKGFIVVDTWQSLQAMLQNKITIFNIGFVSFILLCILFILAIVTKSNGVWRKYIIGAGVAYFLTLNIVPLPTGISQSFIGTIQFAGRLLAIVMLLLTTGCVLFFKENIAKLNLRHISYFLMIFMSILTISTIRDCYRDIGNNSVNYVIDNNNYKKEISKSNGGYGDYMLVTKNRKPIFNETSIPQSIIISVKYNSITMKSKEKVSQIPFLIYKGIPYTVIINEKKRIIQTGKLIKVRAGDKVKIESNATWWNYACFTISILSLSIITIIVLYGECRWHGTGAI